MGVSVASRAAEVPGVGGVKSSGISVGVGVKVRVGKGRGVGDDVDVDVGVLETNGRVAVKTDVGVAYVPQSEGACSQELNNRNTISRMGKVRFTILPSSEL